MLRVAGLGLEEVAALERYSDTVLRLSSGDSPDRLYISPEDTVHVRWVQKSSTGSITSGVRFPFSFSFRVRDRTSPFQIVLFSAGRSDNVGIHDSCSRQAS